MFDGIMDISHNNDIDLSAAQSAGIVAVIHKATEGATFQDRLCATRRAQAKQLGLLWVDAASATSPLASPFH